MMRQFKRKESAANRESNGRGQSRLSRAARQVVEALETRYLLSAGDLSPAHASILAAVPAGMQGQLAGSELQLSPAPAENGAATPHYVLVDSNPSLSGTGTLAPFASSAPVGLSPARLRHAYGIDNIKFGSVTGDGTGQTIAIIDAYDDPTAATDLHAFDQAFGLPDPPSFTKVNQTGGSTLPPVDSSAKGNDWELEESLDIEWAHAVAPQANLILVEANSAYNGDLITAAVGWARTAPGVTAISMSFGEGEFSGESANDSLFTTPSGHAGVTFLASTGDSGTPAGYPAYSPNVVAVGGTTLNTDSSGNYVSEQGWSGSGGGISAYENQPAYQTGVVTQSTTRRTAPDVSSDANPSTGVAVYDTYDFGTATPWAQIGGTSLSSPTWAGLIAIADQGRALSGAGPLDGATQTLPRLYSMAASNYHDITSGSNGYSAGAGYDLVTGRGSPAATTLLPALGASGPYVSSFTPTGLQSTAPSHVGFTFSTPMDPTSFAVASDVDAFAGPGNTDLRSSITGFSWLNNNTTLEVDFTAPTVQGPYTMTVGPQILSAGGTAMDQNQNGLPGETPGDAFGGTFYYDVTPTQVASTNPPAGSTVTAPFNTLHLHLSAPYDPATISTKNLSLSQGTVTAAKVIDATTIEYTLSGIIGGTVNVTMAQGALKDNNENPVLAFNASYTVPITTPPASGWGTYQGDAGHTGYVPGSQDPYYGQPLWSTVMPAASLTDMAVGGGDVYVTSDPSSKVFALNATTGAITWQQGLGSTGSTNAPAYDNGTVFVQTDDEVNGTYFWSFDAATGATHYKTPLGAQWEHYLSPTVAYGNVYVDGGTYGGMYSISETSGAVNWFGTVPQYDQWTPAVNSAFAYTFTGSGDTTPITGKFTILNRQTGATVSVTTDSGFVWNGYSMGEAVALGLNNDAFVTNGNRVLSFSTQSSGGINWTVTDKYTGQVTVANGVLYVQDGSGIAALSESTGATLWTWTPASDSISGRIIATDNMLFASSSTTTYGINLQTQQTAWTVAHGGHLALDHNTLYIASSDGTMTAVGLLPLNAPPFVTGFAPSGLQSTAPSKVDFTFSAAMDPTSFSAASDVDAFTGPGNADLRSSITGFSWLNNNTTLEVTFTQPTVQGPYTITIGPQILSSIGTAMDQNRNGTPGEIPADEFTGTFNYDVTPTQVASTDPAVGAFVSSPFTKIDLHFTAPFDPATVGPTNLTINQGSVTAATIVDPTTIEYTMSGVVTGGTVTITLPQGALLDTNENPVLGFTGNYVIPVPPPPSTGWGTYQGNAGHTGYVSGSLDSSYHQTLWSTAIPGGNLTDMAVGGGNVYVSSSYAFGSATAPSLFALNSATGAINWDVALGSNFSVNAPAYSDGNIYVQTDNESTGTFFWMFDAATGAQKAKTTLDAQWEHYLAPTVAYGNVYVDGGHYGGMYSLSATTGAENWFGSVPQYDQWTPAVNANYCYTFTGSGDTTPITGKFTILNRQTGATVSVTTDQGFAWNGYSMNEAVALGANNDAFVTNGNRLLCFNTQSTGGINWIATDHYTGQVTVADGVLYVQDGSGIEALSEQNGAKLWSWTPANDSISGRIIVNDNMLFTSSANLTYALSLATHQTLWMVTTGGRLALDDRTLYISGSNGTVTAIGMKYASATSLTMASGTNPSRADQPVTFTANVTGGVPDGDTVTLVDAGNNNAVVARGTISGGSATLTVPAGALSAGTHSLVAVYSGDSTFAASQSAALSQTVQAVVTSVVVNGNNAALAGVQRSMVDSIVYTFSQPVTLAASGAFTIAVHAGQTGTVPTLNWAAINPDANGASTQWVVTFSGAGVVGNSIASGVYDITLNPAAASVEGAADATVAARPTDTFYRLFGDINGDRVVNTSDEFQFGKAMTTYNAAFDYNADGAVNLADEFQASKSFMSGGFLGGFVTTI